MSSKRCIVSRSLHGARLDCGGGAPAATLLFVNDGSELAKLDAMAQAQLCASGEVTARELWDACQWRLTQLEPLLRVLVSRAELGSPGPGPLGGVPVMIKDSSPWPGLPWTLGSRLFATRVTQQQTEYVKRLMGAGLNCVGKSTLSEFGLLASTESRLSGATLNPWDLARSPLGSSGGSAVAVAAGLVPLAHANDGGGSIRAPASACGVFGFKPSRGRTVSATRSTSDFSDMTSEHCLSRTVRDSARFLAITEESQHAGPIGFVREPSPRRLRVAAFTGTMFGVEPEAEVRRAHEQAIALLSELGHHVEPITAPRYSAESADAYYVPAAAAVANIVETVDRTRGEPVQRDELEPFTWSLVDDLALRGPRALPLARQALQDAALAYRSATREFDVVLTPTLGRLPPPLGYLSPLLEPARLLERTREVLAYTPIHNVVGAPAMSVPLFWSDTGLPIGTHFAAAPGQDAMLLALAYELEEARPWRHHWPPFSIPALAQASAPR